MSDNHAKILDILAESPSVKLLRLQNSDFIIAFFLQVFYHQHKAMASEYVHAKLADYLEYIKQNNNVDLGDDEEENSLITTVPTYDIRAKKYIRQWTRYGFLTNYQDGKGDIFYELSSHSSKTLDWLTSLKKQEYVGAESKFKNIFKQLEELVEFMNDDVTKRIQLLEQKRKTLTKQIRQLRAGKKIEVFEEFEIKPRVVQLNISARELLSDFKEVEDNFKYITREIYLKHANTALRKGDILEFTFDALDELKDSQQGKSFYAFWAFLLNPSLQAKWTDLTTDLYHMLDEKNIPIHDIFLKKMKKQLYRAGQKVYHANDKMAEKLSRIIRENWASDEKSELVKRMAQDIKGLLVAVSQREGAQKKPNLSFELETTATIKLSFERKLTLEPKKEVVYNDKPELATTNVMESADLEKLLETSVIDKAVLRQHIEQVLAFKSQTTLYEVIEYSGGIQGGLAELMGYFGILKDYQYVVNDQRIQRIMFDKAGQKYIQVPEVILMK